MNERLANIRFTPLLDTLRLQKISDEEYFSEHYSDYISNSRLGLIDPSNEGSPQKFLDGFKGNRIFSDSLTLGTAVHTMVLQPDLFELPPDVQRPTAKVGFAGDELYGFVKDKLNPTREEILKAYSIVDYYGGNPKDEKYYENLPKLKNYLSLRQKLEREENHKEYPCYLDAKTLEKAKGCIEAVQNNKAIQTLLHPTGLIEDPISENEQAILLDVKVDLPDLGEFIVRLKAKLDNYTIDREENVIIVNDLKTIGRTLNYCEDQVIKYHYYREMAIYLYLLSKCATKFYDMKDFRLRSNFLWVSTIPTYYTKVTHLTQGLFKKGFEEFKNLLKLAAVTLYYKNSDSAIEYIGDEL